MVKNFKRRPAICEALLYTGEKADELPDWVRELAVTRFQGQTLANICLVGSKGLQTAWEGQDYLVRHETGDVEVVRKEEFEREFEPIPDRWQEVWAASEPEVRYV